MFGMPHGRIHRNGAVSVSQTGFLCPARRISNGPDILKMVAERTFGPRQCQPDRFTPDYFGRRRCQIAHRRLRGNPRSTGLAPSGAVEYSYFNTQPRSCFQGRMHGAPPSLGTEAYLPDPGFVVAQSDIADKSVVDFICDLVVNLYGGEDLYSVDDNEYKITVGLLHIVDSVFAALHIKPRKLIKVADSFTDFAEPLLHNSGIPSYDAILPIRPFYKEGEQGKKPQEEKKPECSVKKSKKGVPIVVCGILALIILLIPLLLVLGVGFVVNRIKYGKYIKENS